MRFDHSGKWSQSVMCKIGLHKWGRPRMRAGVRRRHCQREGCKVVHIWDATEGRWRKGVAGKPSDFASRHTIQFQSEPISGTPAERHYLVRSGFDRRNPIQPPYLSGPDTRIAVNDRRGGWGTHAL